MIKKATATKVNKAVKHSKPKKTVKAPVKKKPIKNENAVHKNGQRKPAFKERVPEKIENLYELLLVEIADLYSAESQIITHLPKIAAKAANPNLKQALLEHLKETKTQVTRLTKIFTILGVEPKKQWCVGMEGLLFEGAETIAKTIRAATKDACIIASCQKVEHYEICAYGTARAYAIQLKLDRVADLLKETLDEEFQADQNLTKIAEGTFFSTGINKQASDIEEYASRY